MNRTARYAVDRIEGDASDAIVVLVADADGTIVEVPRSMLGHSAVEGAVLTVRLHADGSPQWATAEREPAEEARRRAAAAETLARLRRLDPGGDLAL